MSILDGFKKRKRYIKLSDGNYQLQSEWTSADTVELTSGKTLTQAIDDGDISGGISLTQAEYDALSEEEKNSGKVFYITDVEGEKFNASQIEFGENSNVEEEINELNTNLGNVENALEIYDDVVFTPSDNITVSTDATRLHRQGNHIYGILRVNNTSRRNGLITVGTLNYAPLTTYPIYCFDGSDRTGNIDIPISFILSRGEISIRTDSYIEENHALIFAMDFYTN